MNTGDQDQDTFCSWEVVSIDASSLILFRASLPTLKKPI